MIRLSQLKGQRVIAGDSGQVVGSVRRLLLDAPTAGIVAIELEGVSDGRNIVAWAAVSAIGEDAVILDTAEQPRAPLDEAEQALVAGQLDLEGKPVLEETGDEIGRLEDIAFDQKSGRLSEVHVPGQAIAVDGVSAIGPYALILPASTPQLAATPALKAAF